MKFRIVKPGFFMENFSGMLGALAMNLMQIGLKPETRLDLVVSIELAVSQRKIAIANSPKAADDIGRVVAAVFKVNWLALHCPSPC